MREGSCLTLPIDFNHIGYLYDLVERAQGASSYWSAKATFGSTVPIRGIEGVDYWYEDSCAANKFLGFTATNASLFNASPQFDSTTSSLSIAMVSPHRDINGLQNKGSVSVSVTKAYALCKWGLDPNSTNATMTLQYPQQSAPSPITFELTSDDNFFHLNARDFHFSAPSARVSFLDSRRTRSVKVAAKGRRSMTLQQLVRIPRGFTADWRVIAGPCKITLPQDQASSRSRKAPTLSTPRRGKTCKVMVTMATRTKTYGKPSKTSRTLVNVTR